MNYTYQWCDEEQTSLKRTSDLGGVAYIPADPNNRDFMAYLASDEEAMPYVAPPVPTTYPEEVIRRAYQEESDPLFFKWQAGEGTEEEWKAKREEIHDRYAPIQSVGRVEVS